MATPKDERLDDTTERLIAAFRYSALSDTCVDDLSAHTEADRAALRSRIRELVEEARKDAYSKGYDAGFAEGHFDEGDAEYQTTGGF